MSVQNTKTSVNAYEFHEEAKSNLEKIEKADATVEKANVVSIDKYLVIGEDIRSKHVTYGDYARAAMFPTREAWLEYVAKEKENGVAQPRPKGQTSFQRALDIAKRFHEERKQLETRADDFNATVTNEKNRRTPLSFLIDDYVADVQPKSVTLIDFANWCADKKSANKPPLSPLEKFMKECRHALPELGEEECRRVLEEAIDELG